MDLAVATHPGYVANRSRMDGVLFVPSDVEELIKGTLAEFQPFKLTKDQIMKIAYTMAAGRGDTDLLLFGIARQMMAKGYRVCGTAQINTECEGGGPCDMDVQVLPDGPVLRISQSLGAGSKGCRLDPFALEEAVGLVSTELTSGADILIVNKFGKHEADGRGFRSVIAQAISCDIPVLVGTNALNSAAFQEFTGSEAIQLDPSVSVIQAWIEQAIVNKQHVA